MPNLLTCFFTKPREIGTIAASSPWLSKEMTRQADLDGNVLEIGAGTGPITEWILKSLDDPTRLEIVEIDPRLTRVLRRRFPHVTLHEGDAEDVLLRAKTYRSIISGIPFAIMKKDKRERMFDLIKQKLEPGGRFVQLQLSRVMEKEFERTFGEEHVSMSFVPLNIPPAFVYTWRKPN